MNVMLLVSLGDRKSTLEAKGVMGRVDIITGTLGKPWESMGGYC
jgi:7-keto-8-aminopelargonate synthetase-like enzyme